ncbi:MAG: zinc ribbon domain-containing protein [Lachnospiraceae bacterium]|nr:zinc ribbon domain-containing protein [Lachnospiraceae bacterium]
MNCKRCGSQISEGAAFCFNCGAPVEETAASSNNAAVENSKLEPKIRKQLPKPLWIKDCPVIFNKCVIADRPDGSGEISLSISVLNVSDREIEALYFDLKGLDVLNEEKCDIKNIYSLDMCIKSGEEFKLPEDILLPEKTIRRIRITLRHVCFTDESIWNYDGEDPLTGIDTVTEAVESSHKDAVRKLRDKYLSDGSAAILPEFKNYPLITDDYWICACGRFNIGGKCLSCGAERSCIEEHFTKENIIKEYADRAALNKENPDNNISDKKISDDEAHVNLISDEDRTIPDFDNSDQGIYPISFNGAGSKVTENKIKEEKAADKNVNEEKISEVTQDDDATEILPRNKPADNTMPLFSINENKCRFCGTELKPDDMFCYNCGNKIR